MEALLPIFLIIQTVAIVGLAVVVFRLYRHLSGLSSSFAKMGYVVREDLKQVFEESVVKSAEFTNQASQSNQQAVEQAMVKAMQQSGQAMEQVIAQAHQQAQQIISQAQQDRLALLAGAEKEALKYNDQLVDYSTQALEWAMAQLLHEKFDLSQHQQVIQSLVEVYLDEQKRT